MNNMTNMDASRDGGDHSFQRFAFVVDVFVETTICVIGIICNFLVVYVLHRDDLYPGIRLLYQLLGVADITYMTSCLLFKVLNMLQFWTDIISRLTWSQLDLYYSPFLSITQGLADWHVVLVSLGTYVTVCKPRWAKCHLTVHNVWILSIILWILSLAYHIPMFFEFRVFVNDKTYIYNNGSSNVTVVRPTLFREAILNQHEIYNRVYHTFGFIAFHLVLPLCLLLFGNVAVIRKIHQLDALRKNRNSALLVENSNGGSDNSNARDRRSPQKYARLLKVVVAVYLLCAVPHFAIRTMLLCLPKGVMRMIKLNDTGNVLSYMAIFTSLMYKVNSCCYIVIFSILRQSFRHLMYLTCTCKAS